MKPTFSPFWLLLFVFFVSCAQDKKNDTSNAAQNPTHSSDPFEISLGPSFYMNGDDLNDLYISATVRKGSLKENTAVELVKKGSPSEKVTATIYRIEDKKFKALKTATAGQEVTISLKVNNDKGFRISSNADEYALVPQGQAVKASGLPQSAKAKITINGKPWDYNYCKIYHYTKDYGITKNPANFLIVFTKPNKRLKNTPEELIQISLFHAKKGPKEFQNSEIDFTLNTDMFGKETAYTKTFGATNKATATVTQYAESGAKARLSAHITANAKAYLCPQCPNVQVDIQFEGLEAELYNN